MWHEYQDKPVDERGTMDAPLVLPPLLPWAARVWTLWGLVRDQERQYSPDYRERQQTIGTETHTVVDRIERWTLDVAAVLGVLPLYPDLEPAWTLETIRDLYLTSRVKRMVLALPEVARALLDEEGPGFLDQWKAELGYVGFDRLTAEAA